jgi:hypothetical protein
MGILKHAETLGGKSTFQATSRLSEECLLRGLANGPSPRSLNDFFLEEQLSQLFERIPTGGPKTANLWSASVNSRLISSSTMRVSLHCTACETSCLQVRKRLALPFQSENLCCHLHMISLLKLRLKDASVP